MIELALPAGTINEALTAFRAGADAVYFGMKEFSARKGAGNFSIDDLSRIRRFSLRNGKKIYVAVNTLVDDGALPALYGLIGEISDIGADGIITQDLGVARILKKDFPTLPIHGSTQLAIHTAAGVKALQALGFERVVLARELTLGEIESIRKACPDVELKVFIHGALCYGFSGLCMASHEITGRSANEGACAQICRTWFTDEQSGEKLYPFSMKDLDAGALVRRLDAIGIDSLKVEGRMKGPEYVEAVTRYYRALLAGEDAKKEKRAVSLSFQREASEGYFMKAGPGHENMLTGGYTGHKGIRIGQVLDQRGRKLLVESRERIKEHDGLMVLTASGGLLEPYRFSAKVLEHENSRYILMLPEDRILPPHSILHMISDSSLNCRAVSVDIPEGKRQIAAEIEISDASVTIRTSLLEKRYEAEILPSENSAGNTIQKCFGASGDARYCLSPITVLNADGKYLNPGRMKAIRRDYLSLLEALPVIERRYETKAEDARTPLLPERSLLDGRNAPWNMEGCVIDGRTYLSFPAVRFNEEEVFREMERKAEHAVMPVIGLNNVGDIIFAKAHPQYMYYADIYLYMSNREAASLLKEEIPSLIGGYLWVEREKNEAPWPFTPTPVKDYRMPLFISRSCYRHDALRKPCDGCSRRHSYEISQNGRHYHVTVEDCLTVVR